MGQTEATVIAPWGPTAYPTQAQPWCVAGDQVIFARYAGTERVGADGEVYRLINDLDVKAIYTGGTMSDLETPNMPDAPDPAEAEAR